MSRGSRVARHCSRLPRREDRGTTVRPSGMNAASTNHHENNRAAPPRCVWDRDLRPRVGPRYQLDPGAPAMRCMLAFALLGIACTAPSSFEPWELETLSGDRGFSLRVPEFQVP